MRWRAISDRPYVEAGYADGSVRAYDLVSQTVRTAFKLPAAAGDKKGAAPPPSTALAVMKGFGLGGGVGSGGGGGALGVVAVGDASGKP
jgi:hypothetical protein